MVRPRGRAAAAKRAKAEEAQETNIPVENGSDAEDDSTTATRRKMPARNGRGRPPRLRAKEKVEENAASESSDDERKSSPKKRMTRKAAAKEKADTSSETDSPPAPPVEELSNPEPDGAIEVAVNDKEKQGDSSGTEDEGREAEPDSRGRSKSKSVDRSTPEEEEREAQPDRKHSPSSDTEEDDGTQSGNERNAHADDVDADKKDSEEGEIQEELEEQQEKSKEDNSRRNDSSKGGSGDGRRIQEEKEQRQEDVRHAQEERRTRRIRVPVASSASTDGDSAPSASGSRRKRGWGSVNPATLAPQTPSISTDSLKELSETLAVKKADVDSVNKGGDDDTMDISVHDEGEIDDDVTGNDVSDKPKAQKENDGHDENKTSETAAPKPQRQRRERIVKVDRKPELTPEEEKAEEERKKKRHISIDFDDAEKKDKGPIKVVNRVKSVEDVKSTPLAPRQEVPLVKGPSAPGAVAEEFQRRKSVSPAKQPVSKILFIRHLVRPFTFQQLRELVTRKSPSIDESLLWVDRIKSKCFVVYHEEEQAVAAREDMHNLIWPLGNPNCLKVDFCTLEEMERIKDPSKAASRGAAESRGRSPVRKREEPEVGRRRRISGGDGVAISGGGLTSRGARNDEKLRLKRSDGPSENEGSREASPITAPLRLRQSPQPHSSPPPSAKKGIREWDRHKINPEATSPPRRRRESPPEERHRNRHRSAEDEPPAKTLDELFRKTKATPCIYWLPLSEEAALRRAAERKQRELDRERRAKEREAARRRSRSRTPPRREDIWKK